MEVSSGGPKKSRLPKAAVEATVPPDASVTLTDNEAGTDSTLASKAQSSQEPRFAWVIIPKLKCSMNQWSIFGPGV